MLSTGDKTVRASTATAFAARSPLRSYIASTRDHGQPGRKNITGGVDIPVVLDSALGTRPRTHVERQGIHYRAARRTGLARRTPTVDVDKGTSMPLAFVLQLANELAPAGIANSPGKRMVRHHAAHIQVLDCDRLVFTNQPGTQVMQEVAANIRNLLVDLGHADACLEPSDRAAKQVSPRSMPIAPSAAGIGSSGSSTRKET